MKRWKGKVKRKEGEEKEIDPKSKNPGVLVGIQDTTNNLYFHQNITKCWFRDLCVFPANLCTFPANFCFLEVYGWGRWRLKRMIWYMMPADQEKTSTPHLDLVIRLNYVYENYVEISHTLRWDWITFTKTLLIKVTPCNRHCHHSKTVDKLASNVNWLCSKPAFSIFIWHFIWQLFQFHAESGRAKCWFKELKRNLLTSLSRQKE